MTTEKDNLPPVETPEQIAAREAEEKELQEFISDPKNGRALKVFDKLYDRRKIKEEEDAKKKPKEKSSSWLQDLGFQVKE